MWRRFLGWLGFRPRDQGEGSAGTVRGAEQYLLRRRAQPVDLGPPMSLADQALRRADTEIRGMRRRRPRRSAFHCHPERNGSVERRNIGKYQSCRLEIARGDRRDPAFAWRVIGCQCSPGGLQS